MIGFACNTLASDVLGSLVEENLGKRWNFGLRPHDETCWNFSSFTREEETEICSLVTECME